MPIGTVKWFDVTKGFGFIHGCDGEEQDIFVHYTAIFGDGFRVLREGERVEFELLKTDKGPQAKAVRRLDVGIEGDGSPV